MTNDDFKQETAASGNTPPENDQPQSTPTEPAAQPAPKSSTPRPRTTGTSARKKADNDTVHSTTAQPKTAQGSTSRQRNSDSGAGKASGAKKPKQEKVDLKEVPRSTKPAHRVIPYVLVGLAVFVAVCLLLNLVCNQKNQCEANPSAHLMGSVGYYVCYWLFGLLGPAVFALPALILNMALFWKSYIDNRLVLEKSIGSAVLLLLISTTVHVFCLSVIDQSYWAMTSSELIEAGARMTGGGLFGGSIGFFFVSYLNRVGGIIVSIFLTLLAAFFFLGMTPQHILEHIRTKRNLKAAGRTPLGVDEEERIKEQMQQKHARAAAKGSQVSIYDTQPPTGAVHYTEGHAPSKKKAADELAPMPMPVLDATDESTGERPLYVPEDLNKTDDKPTDSKPQATQPTEKPAAPAVPASPAAPTRPAGNGARPAPLKSADEKALDSLFPRNHVDPKASNRIQKSDRNFELENIFVNLDDHKPIPARKHAPLPPEVPMPASSARPANLARPAAPAARPAGAPAKPAARPAGTPATAANPRSAGTSAGAVRPAAGTRPASSAATPAQSARPAPAGMQQALSRSAPAAGPVKNKPIYRQATSTGQSDYGLSNEEFEKREAASQSISRAMANTKAGSAPDAAKPARKPATVTATTANKKPAPVPEKKQYIFPPISYLHPGEPMTAENQAEIAENMEKLSATLDNFNIRVNEITYSCGPTVTRYEIFPSAGVRVRSITNLADDIALSFAVQGVRMEAIAGKSAIGVEVPNTTRCTVFLRDLIESKAFAENGSRLSAGLGADVTGNPLLFDIAKMPHLLVAGTTGSGKSICINCIIMSILYKARPDEVKLIMIDPKKVEFNLYKGIPHLMAPIILTPKDAAGALQAAVNEMEDRFTKIQEVGVHDISGYNKAAAKDPELTPMPHIVIIIDELADLMMTARDEVEDSICRLAQKARAAGMHIIVGTQRPSVDVVTGLIKSNIPSRIACTVRSQVDSRTILDFAGAEKLLGKGDMLFAPIGSMKPTRVQGAFVSDSEVEKICEFIRATNGTANYDENFTSKMKEYSAQCGNKKGKGGDSDVSLPGGDGGDNKYVEAIRVCIEEKRVSTSLLQRKLGIGYSRAAKIIDRMEEEGLVTKPDGSKPRNILISAEEFIERYVEGNAGEGEDL